MINQFQDIFVNFSDVRPFKCDLLNRITGNSSRWLMKVLGNVILPIYFRLNPSIQSYYEKRSEGKVCQAYVTLTTFPLRAKVVWLVIECLLRQSVVPNRIIIYLSEEQFPDMDSVPKSLKLYPTDIVEIRVVKGDIRSHKKYWYATKEFDGHPIITVDDDIIYDSKMIEDLEKFSSSTEKTIACCWGGNISWNSDGILKPYSEWRTNMKLFKRDDTLFFGSGGGTYFPSGSLRDAHKPIEVLKIICPTADDIWLNAIARKNGYRSCLIRKRNSVPELAISRNVKLCTENNGLKKNDVQLFSVQNYIIKNFNIDPFLFCNKL